VEPNSNTVKLANLLAQYLYTNKKLDLAGIGTFSLDPSVVIEPETTKNRPATPEGISFQTNLSVPEDPQLIKFVSEKSGKMKALATADIDSYVQLALQFLNISKPYVFEGIGTLAKLKNGTFEFTPGIIISEKKDIPERDVHGLSKKESTEAKYQAFLATPSVKSVWKKPVVAFLVLCGIALAIWSGYAISTRNDQPTEEVVDAGLATTAINDSMNKAAADSISALKQKSENYKYVLEVAQSKRAFKRYNQLKTIDWKVQLETTDSVQYKLYMLLPATSDSIHVMDSLTALTGKRVYIENSN
jgi:HAMP domain-containing protein